MLGSGAQLSRYLCGRILVALHPVEGLFGGVQRELGRVVATFQVFCQLLSGPLAHGSCILTKILVPYSQ